jgi:hypothetical protein
MPAAGVLRSFWLGLFLLSVVPASLAAVHVINEAPGVLEAAAAAPTTRGKLLAEHLAAMAALYRELGVMDIGTASEQYAASLDGQRAGLQRLADARSIEVELDAALKGFRARFPAFDADNLSIYVLPSFGRFQAQSRIFQKHPTLLLDTGFFATMTAGTIPRPFVHHELLHLYHYQLRPDVAAGAEAFFRTGQPPSLGSLLWVEGLAVHVARQLNPGAPDAQLFPSAAIVPATQQQYSRLMLIVRDRVDESTMSAICQFFYFPCPDEKNPIPMNSGYVLGERLVNGMLESDSLEKVMLLKDGELSSAVLRAANGESALARKQ